MSKFCIVNLLDMLEEVEEDAVMDILSTFHCPLNMEIENFLKKRAVEFAKKKISVTYLVFNNKNSLVAYITLAHKPTLIPCQSMSKSTLRKLNRFSLMKPNEDNLNISAFLVAQFGKDTTVPKQDNICGSELMNMCLEILIDVQRRIGGSVVFLECEDNEKLMQFYSEQKFKFYNKRNSSEGIVYNQLLLCL